MINENSNYISFKELGKYDNLINFYTNKNVGINYSIKSRDEIRSKLQDLSSYTFRKIISPKQTHTKNVAIITEDNLDSELQDVDGVITNLRGVALTIATADCQSIMIYDKERQVIGNVHSGWKGTLSKILRQAISLIIEYYGSSPKDLVVCIGPSILECCFEVDEDVVLMFKDSFNDINDLIRLGDIKEGKQKYYIDTVGINIKELLELGVDRDNIITCNICTKCESNKFHSYRADGANSGRNVSLICIK